MNNLGICDILMRVGDQKMVYHLEWPNIKNFYICWGIMSLN